MTHEHKLITEEARMTIAKPSIHVSDSIEFKSISTGGNSAGNGGDGSFKGYVVNAPTLSFDPSNTASGASVHVNTGDHVDQKAYWDAGKASADAEKLSKAYANANSNGDQSSKSGHDTSKVYADTTVTQTNSLMADMHQDVMAGIGGNGGSGNAALGGNVDFNFDSSI
jgi:hypothetical protein